MCDDRRERIMTDKSHMREERRCKATTVCVWLTGRVRCVHVRLIRRCKIGPVVLRYDFVRHSFGVQLFRVYDHLFGRLRYCELRFGVNAGLAATRLRATAVRLRVRGRVIGVSDLHYRIQHSQQVGTVCVCTVCNRGAARLASPPRLP